MKSHEVPMKALGSPNEVTGESQWKAAYDARPDVIARREQKKERAALLLQKKQEDTAKKEEKKKKLQELALLAEKTKRATKPSQSSPIIPLEP